MRQRFTLALVRFKAGQTREIKWWNKVEILAASFPTSPRQIVGVELSSKFVKVLAAAAAPDGEREKRV